MTVEEAIKQLREQVVPNGSPASVDAIAMAISALEKEKEPAPQEAETSSNNNCSIKNDNIKLNIFQEIIDNQIEDYVDYYNNQLSDDEQKAFNEGQRYRELLNEMRYLREEKQREYKAELIESGQTAYCEECGKIFNDVCNDLVHKNEICFMCARDESGAIIRTIRRLALENAANSDEKQRVATALSFIEDYLEEFQQFLRVRK